MAKGNWLLLSSYDNIGYTYTVDKFNQRLNVRLTTKVPADLHDSYLKEAICEAYDHYNHTHPEQQFIHPDSIDTNEH